MYEKGRHKLKRPRRGLAWRQALSQTTQKTGFNVHECQREVWLQKFPAFPMGARSSREGVQPGGWLLGSSLRGVGCRAAPTSQLVLHSFLVIILLQVRLLCLLQIFQILREGEGKPGRSRFKQGQPPALWGAGSQP